MKRLLNIKEAAQFLGISERTIYNGICRKSRRPFPIKPKRIGRVVRFDIQDLEKYIESL
jgi:excisionase family DNA binding protein